MARKKTPPLDGELILKTLLQRSLDGENGQAYPLDSWGRDPDKISQITKDRVELVQRDAQPLVDAGLLRYNNQGTCYYALTSEGIRQTLPKVKYKPLDIKALCEWLCERALFNPSKAIDGETAIPLIYKPGTGRIVLVLGENAGGKSLVRRLVSMATHRGQGGGYGQEKIPKGEFPVREFIGLSMEFRSGPGMERMFVFGHEGWQSTGEISGDAVVKAIQTVSNRDHPTILYWDEPDIGMSAGAAAGAGAAIREFVENLAPLCQAVFVTSHSVPLVRQLVATDPHYIFVGDPNGPQDLDAWFAYQQNPPVILPAELAERSRRRFSQIKAVLDAKPREKRKP